MKNKTVFIVLGIILVLLIGGGITLFLSLNKEKVSMTATQFKTSMEEKDFVITDATNQFSGYDYIEQVYIASSSDYSYQIEFYELSDEDYAITLYNNNKSIFKSSEGNVAGETNVDMKNYSKYTLLTNGKYKVVSRIDNTVVYLNVDSSKKDSVKNILKKLGY